MRAKRKIRAANIPSRVPGDADLPERIAEGQALVARCVRQERPGPYQLQAAMAAVDGLDLDSYHLWHASRADLLRRLDRHAEAAAAYEAAASLATNDAERAYLEQRHRGLAQ